MRMRIAIPLVTHDVILHKKYFFYKRLCVGWEPLGPAIFIEICCVDLVSQSVDIRPLPSAWVSEVLGTILGVQDQ